MSRHPDEGRGPAGSLKIRDPDTAQLSAAAAPANSLQSAVFFRVLRGIGNRSPAGIVSDTGGSAMQQDDWQERVEQYRGIARELRRIAEGERLDLRRHDQLIALAEGFDRLADRIAYAAAAADTSSSSE
jgi:hypothetical protein